MFKIMWLLRRRDDISFEQFRDHYERSHALLGQKYLGHLMIDYTRNYNLGRAEGASGVMPGPDYDCITEWTMRDAAAFDEAIAIIGDPAIGRIFHDDQDMFVAPGGVRLVICDVRNTGTGAPPA